ncbi:hypothetical protein RUM44_009668 [Polyplax serrata]|uniref:FLYWCH-type domain-containing protein n=1 Tax=Polyplax serrata TaxID=468196 RepID=A0ABR1ATE9_POLSC
MTIVCIAKKFSIKEYSFRKSVKGNLILQHGGYDYRYGGMTSSTLRWRCCKDKKYRCPGRAIMDSQTGEINIKCHNHTVGSDSMKKLELEDLFKKN